MVRQAKYALLPLVVALAVAVWLLWLRGEEAWSGGGPRWGRGPLKISERAYYMSHVSSTLAAARYPGEQGGDSGLVYLVIDAAKKQIWIESNGRVVQEYHTDLPSGMDWRLYRSAPDGSAELAPVSRFCLHARPTKRRFLPEQVWLVGTRGRQENMHFAFSSDASLRCGFDEGPWNATLMQWLSSASQALQDGSYESIVVNDADYEKARPQFTSDNPTPAQSAGMLERRAVWTRAETRLYQEVERQLSRKGLRLWNMEIKPGPGGTAAFGQYTAGYGGLRSVRRGSSSGQAWLKMDYMGHDLWYARSAPNPLQPKPIKPHLELEYLVSVGEPIKPREAADVLAQGRKKQQRDLLPSSKWRAELPDGAGVELIGLCRNAGGYSRWWGPDGSPLDYYMLSSDYEPYEPLPGNRVMYEIAWHIQTPLGIGLLTQASLEGSSGSYYRQIVDRYANPLGGGLQAGSYAFDKSQEKATLRVGVKSANGEYLWATFKNISLVPGSDQGFEVVEGKAAE